MFWGEDPPCLGGHSSAPGPHSPQGGPEAPRPGRTYKQPEGSSRASAPAPRGAESSPRVKLGPSPLLFSYHCCPLRATSSACVIHSISFFLELLTGVPG